MLLFGLGGATEIKIEGLVRKTETDGPPTRKHKTEKRGVEDLTHQGHRFKNTKKVGFDEWRLSRRANYI